MTIEKIIQSWIVMADMFICGLLQYFYMFSVLAIIIGLVLASNYLVRRQGANEFAYHQDRTESAGRSGDRRHIVDICEMQQEGRSRDDDKG